MSTAGLGGGQSPIEVRKLYMSSSGVGDGLTPAAPAGSKTIPAGQTAIVFFRGGATFGGGAGGQVVQQDGFFNETYYDETGGAFTSFPFASSPADNIGNSTPGDGIVIFLDEGETIAVDVAGVLLAKFIVFYFAKP